MKRLISNFLNGTKAQPLPRPEEGKLKAKGQRLILVVDDEAINRLLVRQILEAKGFAVAEVFDGQEALDRIEQGLKPDLILLDIMMPGLSGIETCASIRLSHPMHKLPIVFLTAIHDTKSIKLAYAAGGNDYLTKPINRDELLARVNALLGGLDLYHGINALLSQVPKLQLCLSQEAMLELYWHHLKTNWTFQWCCLFRGSTTLKREGNCAWEGERDKGEAWSEAIGNLLKPKGRSPALAQIKATEIQRKLGIAEQKAPQGVIFIHRLGLEAAFILLGQKKGGIPLSSIEAELIEAWSRLCFDFWQALNKANEPDYNDAKQRSLMWIRGMLDQVLYVRSKNHDCEVHHEQGNERMRLSLGLVEAHFEPEELLKVHRSYLINPKKVISLEKNGRNYQLTMLGAAGSLVKIPISRNLLDPIKDSHPFWFT